MTYILKARADLHSGQLYTYDICVQHSRATLAIATSDDIREVLSASPKEVRLSVILHGCISSVSSSVAQVTGGPGSFRKALAKLQPQVVADSCGGECACAIACTFGCRISDGSPLQ